MASSPETNDTVYKLVQEFIDKHGYVGHAGFFEEKWQLYKDLSPADFEEVESNTDMHMVLPGKPLELQPGQRCSLIIQTIGLSLHARQRKWFKATGRRLHRQVRQRAERLGAPSDLANQLADFISGHIEEKHP